MSEPARPLRLAPAIRHTLPRNLALSSISQRHARAGKYDRLRARNANGSLLRKSWVAGNAGGVVNRVTGVFSGAGLGHVFVAWVMGIGVGL